MKPQISIVVASMLFAATVAHADVVISTKPTRNMTCDAGGCSPTATDAVLNATELVNMLGDGDVKVTTGSGATSILVKATLGWTGASRLTLDAIQSVEIDKPVMVTGTGAMTITTNDGGAGGDFIFDGTGNVTFWDLQSSLIVNSNGYTLAGDIATLASDIDNNPSGFYALANDYDASVDGTYTVAPVTTVFKGIFEGLGHTIANLHVNSSSYAAGLFAEASGTLRDIGLPHVAITGSSQFVGSLLGDSDSANIVGCYATGSVALADGSIVVGGLVGSGIGGTIARSHAAVAVRAESAGEVGGLVGGSTSAISRSYATGTVKAGDNAFAGGLVGGTPTALHGSVSESYATGDVTAGEKSKVGGLVGSGSSSDITNAYATGAVKGGTTTSVGGLAGQIAFMHIQNSYSTGHVKGGVKNVSRGGFVGYAGGGGDELGADYWDTDTSGTSPRQGFGTCDENGCKRAVKGLTTEEFQAGLPDGFDPNIWGEKTGINNGHPYLIALPPK
jgi:hypothetical protein